MLKMREVISRNNPFRRVPWWISRHLGPRSCRWRWNDQYRRGFWKYLRAPESRNQAITEFIAEHARGGGIVELGCGEGTLICTVDPVVYSSYLGLDISDVAIEEAIERTSRLGLNKCRFDRMNMEDWVGGRDISVVIFEERPDSQIKCNTSVDE